MRNPKPTLTLLLVALAACGPAPAAPTQPPTAPLPSPTLQPSPQPSDTPAPTPTLGAGATLVSPADGMTLVYVPAGPFPMGSEGGYADEHPQHEVDLGAFWIDRTEVTNAMYTRCVEAGACQRPRRNSSNIYDYYFVSNEYADYPVIYVDWEDARAYCEWAGRRLPSEAEWEKAARGTDGRTFPWGNAPADESLANFGHNQHDVTAVGSYPAGASPYGALDMAGNVMEWVADWYNPDYYAASPQDDPPGPDSGERRGLRGGSWIYQANGIRSSYRDSQAPDFADYETGFRCLTTTP